VSPVFAATLRDPVSASINRWGAVLWAGGERFAGPVREIAILDRVGGGDAFASGVLFGVWSGWSNDEALAFGLAAAGLKHSVPGDFNLFDQAQVRAAMTAEGFDIRR
jgi:2-dehydro-3-deoxygluconokinase